MKSTPFFKAKKAGIKVNYAALLLFFCNQTDALMLSVSTHKDCLAVKAWTAELFGS